MKKSKIKKEEDFELEKEYDFSKGVRGRFYKPRKVSTTIRIDDDILMFFKKFEKKKKIYLGNLGNLGKKKKKINF